MSHITLDMSRELRRLSNELLAREEYLYIYTKAIANRVRLGVLILLTEKNRSFAKIAEKLRVQKTALSNHLNELLDVKLIYKTGSRGHYSLTDTGLLLIESLADFVSRSSRREQQKVGPFYLISKPTIEMIEMKSNQVKNRPEFQPSWLSLVASVTGILKSFGENFDNIDVAGYSGHAFIACMTEGYTSAAPPTAHPFFGEVHEGIESLGFQFFGDYQPGAIFPDKEISLADDKRLIKLFEMVKGQIDKNNPVILWGPYTAEFAIVYGYKDDKYLVSSFKSEKGKPDEPVNYRDLHIPGGIWFYYFGKRTHNMTEEHDLLAIKRALQIVKGKKRDVDVKVGVVEATEDYEHVTEWSEKEMEFVTGFSSFEVWKETLRVGSKDPSKIDAFGNACTSATYQESYGYAKEFLSRIADNYSDRSFCDKLKEASSNFGKLQEYFTEFIELFPFNNSLKRIEKKEDLELGCILLGRCSEEYQKTSRIFQDIIDLWDN